MCYIYVGLMTCLRGSLMRELILGLVGLLIFSGLFEERFGVRVEESIVCPVYNIVFIIFFRRFHEFLE